MSLKEEVLKDVVIKFAGDSGDGMQLTGNQFTNNTAMLGIDLATFPDFPAEIRAPIGTLPGVSGYQLRFSSDRIFTPGDSCDVLVAMNAAALKSNLKQGGTQQRRVLTIKNVNYTETVDEEQHPAPKYVENEINNYQNENKTVRVQRNDSLARFLRERPQIKDLVENF